jgi:hypothetical protein
MHACLLHICNHALLHFIVYCYLFSKIGHGFVHGQCHLDKDRSIVMHTSSIRLCSVLRFKAPEWFLICWQIASCSYMSSYMAFSRKYGTVWYHPASSKLWYLTTLSFVNFQGKLTGTLWNLLACEATLFGLLCA